MKDEQFESIRKGIQRELIWAHQHFKIFWDLYTAPNDVADVRDYYRSFFSCSMMAHNNCFCISVCNVVNYNQQTSNFPRLINYISSNKKLVELYKEDELNRANSVLGSHAELIKRMLVTRDQYIAHNQLKKNHFGVNTAYKHDEGEQLLSDLRNIFNSISSKYDNVYQVFEVTPKLNVAQLLRDLNEYHQNEDKKIKDSIGWREGESLEDFIKRLSEGDVRHQP